MQAVNRNEAINDPLFEQISAIIAPWWISFWKGVGTFGSKIAGSFKSFLFEETGGAYMGLVQKAFASATELSGKRGALSAAAKAYQSHMSDARKNPLSKVMFPTVSKDAASLNAAAREAVKDILEHPEAIRLPSNTGGYIEIWSPVPGNPNLLRGMRLKADGTFDTFLEGTLNPW